MCRVSSKNAPPTFSGSGSCRPSSFCDARNSSTIFWLRSAMEANCSAAAAMSGGAASVRGSVMAQILSVPASFFPGRNEAFHAGARSATGRVAIRRRRVSRPRVR